MSDEMLLATQLSRRESLKAGLAVGATVALAGCDPLMRRDVSTKVLVIGAGLAGLHAMRLLEQAGVEAILVEATDRIGGRVCTASDNDIPGGPELGASGIGTHYARLISTAQELGVALVAERKRTDPVRGELAYYVDGEVILPEVWPNHPRNLFPLGPLKSTPLHLVQFAIYGEPANPLPRGDFAAWQRSVDRRSDVSVYDAMKASTLSDEFMHLAFGTNPSYGTDERDLSMLMGFQSSNLYTSLYTGTGALKPDAKAVAGGNQRLPEAMAKSLKSTVHLGDPVVSIDVMAGRVRVAMKSGRRYSADRCICTMPFSALRRIQLQAPLVPAQRRAIQTLAYTPVYQVHFTSTKPFWEADRLPLSMWTDGPAGRFMALRNDEAAPDRVTSHLAFVNGRQALALDRMAPADAQAKVMEYLGQIRPATRGALRPVTSLSWISNPYAGGAYAYWQPGQISDFAISMRAPAGRLHFAGEHTAVVNRGMEGAMESGERAALEVIESLQSQKG